MATLDNSSGFLGVVRGTRFAPRATIDEALCSYEHEMGEPPHQPRD